MKLNITLQPKQGLLYYLVEHSQASILGFGGSRGGAKSGGMRRIALKRRLDYPKTSCIIMRRVWDDVEKNHLTPFFNEFPDLRQFYKTAEHCVVLPTQLGGGRIYFDSAEVKADVERKAYGPEFMDMFIDQAEQFTEEEIVQLKTVVRWPGMSLHACKQILGFNPGGVGAAYLQRIFSLKEYHDRESKEDYGFVQAYGWDNVEWCRAALVEDNLTEADFYKWDSRTRYQYYITRSQYGREQDRLPAHLRSGQLLGDFKKFAGQYFSNFDEAVHVWPRQDIILQPYHVKWGSFDWGFKHSAVFQWHAQVGTVDSNGRAKRLVVTFDELVADHLSERALAEQIATRNGNIRLARIYAGHDVRGTGSTGRTKETEMNEVFQRCGMPRMELAKIDRVDGWRHMHTALDEGEWIITDNCINVRRAIPSAIFNEREKGKEEDVLKTNTVYDDVLDCSRYGLYSERSPTDVPDSIKLQRSLSHIEDPTARAIMSQKLQSQSINRLANEGIINNRSIGRYGRYSHRN